MNTFQKFFKQNIFYPLLLLVIIASWLITTESGLKASFWLIRPFFPGQLAVKNIQGKWIDQIKIQDLAFESNNLKFTIEALTIKPLIFKLLYNDFHISSFSFNNTTIEIKNTLSSPILITHSEGELELNKNGPIILVRLNKTTGILSDLAFHGYARFHILRGNIEACNVDFHLNKHQFKIMQSGVPNKLDWFLTLRETKNTDAQLQGTITAETLKKWIGEITIVQIDSKFIGKWNLKSPCPFYLAPSEVSFGTLQLQQASDTLVTAFAHWDKKDGFDAEIHVPLLELHHPNLQGKSTFHITARQKINQVPFLKGQLTLFPGNIILSLNEKKQVTHPYLGGNLDFSFDQKGLKAEFFFKESMQNFIEGSVKTLDNSALLQPLKEKHPKTDTILDWLDQKITGNITAQWSDLSRIYSFIPEIAKLKGSLDINGKITGSARHPLLSLQANIKKTAFFIPKQGIQIKNLDCKISGNLYEKFTLEGTGLAGDGAFTVKGTSYLNKEPKATLELNGKNLQIYNTTNIQIIASPAVTLNYANHMCFLQGSVQISEAYIFIRDNKNYASPSKDVVLVNSKDENAAHPFKIVPSLYLKIENQLHFKGYGLDGIVGGKLAIDQRPDGLLSGTGRLTIKEGKYRLQGATRYIHHGHLLFPPGTLLSDPILDILISQKRVGEQREGADVGIYVQGTLQNPLPHLYSSAPLQNADILSRLGLGSTEVTGTENQRQVLTQTAFLLSGNANPFMDLLQTNLGLEEFSLESRETNTISTQGGTDTVFVVGRPLSKKLYLQCLQNVMEPVTTVKLKYFLGPYLSTSVETGTEGLGGDITFSMEKD